MNTSRMNGIALGLLLAATLPAQAAPVDFETTPAGLVPVDNAPLADAYTIDGGGSVSFYFDVNGDNAYSAAVDLLPVFEQAGNADPQNGFFNTGLGVYDVTKPGFAARLGQYFLRQPESLGAIPAPFIVDYSTGQSITALSGEIWDIDAPSSTVYESWHLEVLDAAGTVLAAQDSPVGTSQTTPFDGAPWQFSFAGLAGGVDKLRITYTGTKPGSIGLAFDNFSPTTAAPAVPEPASGALAVLGLAALGILARRRR